MTQGRSNTSTEPHPPRPLKDPGAPVSADDWLPEEDQSPPGSPGVSGGTAGTGGDNKVQDR